MKLTSEPKPVRIRIVSGGEEHSSLDSLRRNFCLPDLQKIEKQLILWLNRQGNEGQDIAQELQTMHTKLSDCASLDDFFVVYKILFKDIIPLVDSLGKVYEWFDHNQNRYSKNLVSLRSILWGVDENYTISVIEKENRITKEHVNILNRFNSARAHFLLSRYFFEVKKDFSRGEKLLEQAKAEGCKEAKTYIVDKRAQEYLRKWPDIDIEYMKTHIEFLINNWEFNIPHEWTENEKQLHTFVANSLSIAAKKYNFTEDAYNDALKYFGTKRKGRNNEYSINNNFLYEQKLFVINVIELDVYRLYDDAIKGLTEQSESYYPAKYLIDKSEMNPLLDSANYRRRGYPMKIKILLQNLFVF